MVLGIPTYLSRQGHWIYNAKPRGEKGTTADTLEQVEAVHL
jgi:hypothetical protein